MDTIEEIEENDKLLVRSILSVYTFAFFDFILSMGVGADNIL